MLYYIYIYIKYCPLHMLKIAHHICYIILHMGLAPLRSALLDIESQATNLFHGPWSMDHGPWTMESLTHMLNRHEHIYKILPSIYVILHYIRAWLLCGRPSLTLKAKQQTCSMDHGPWTMESLTPTHSPQGHGPRPMRHPPPNPQSPRIRNGLALRKVRRHCFAVEATLPLSIRVRILQPLPHDVHFLLARRVNAWRLCAICPHCLVATIHE